MDIKTKVKNSLLFDTKTKEKILAIKGKIPKELEQYLKAIFSVYERKEEEILKDIEKMIPIIYLQTIQDLEAKKKKEEANELEKMEEMILNI